MENFYQADCHVKATSRSSITNLINYWVIISLQLNFPLRGTVSSIPKHVELQS